MSTRRRPGLESLESRHLLSRLFGSGPSSSGPGPAGIDHGPDPSSRGRPADRLDLERPTEVLIVFVTPHGGPSWEPHREFDPNRGQGPPSAPPPAMDGPRSDPGADPMTPAPGAEAATSAAADREPQRDPSASLQAEASAPDLAARSTAEPPRHLEVSANLSTQVRGTVVLIPAAVPVEVAGRAKSLIGPAGNRPLDPAPPSNLAIEIRQGPAGNGPNRTAAIGPDPGSRERSPAGREPGRPGRAFAGISSGGESETPGATAEPDPDSEPEFRVPSPLGADLLTRLRPFGPEVDLDATLARIFDRLHDLGPPRTEPGVSIADLVAVAAVVASAEAARRWDRRRRPEPSGDVEGPRASLPFRFS